MLHLFLLVTMSYPLPNDLCNPKLADVLRNSYSGMEAVTLSTRFVNANEDWSGLAEPKKRKQLQNRINQRARSM